MSATGQVGPQHGMRVALAIVLAAVAAAAVLAFAVAGCKQDSPHLDRARKLMTSGQWANARTALGQALDDQPGDLQARGLLLYCLDHEDGLPAITGLELNALFTVAVLTESPAWGSVDKKLRTLIDDEVTNARKALFDKGIDTKEVAELRAVVIATARWGFVHEKDVERRDRHAAILAHGGDQPALAHLIERLKSQEPRRVVSYLADVGPGAIEALRKVIADKGFIGGRPARDALARILAAERARTLVAERPALRDPAGEESELAGRARLGSSILPVSRDLATLRVHAQVVTLPDTDEALVVLQGWDDSKGVLVAELHALRGGELQRLQVRRADRTAFELVGPAALFDLEVERGAVLLRRQQEGVVEAEVETGRVTRPTPGMRVRLRGHAPHGTLVGEDAGLWVVKVDTPIEGMRELPVALASLIGLRAERRVERSVETVRMVLKSDAAEVVSTSVAREDEP